MAEAQTVQTTETPAAPPPDAADAFLDGMAAAVKGEAGLASPELDEVPSEKDAAAPPEAPPEPEIAPFDPSKDFSPEELATPEGIQAAAAQIRGGLKEFREKMVALDGRFAKFKEKEARQKATFEKWAQERETNALATRQIFDMVQGVRAGNAETRMRSLGALLQMDPLQALEEINTGIATDGKGRPRTPEEIEAEVERRLDAKLEAKLRERQMQAQQEYEVRELTQRARGFASRIEAGAYPALSRFYALNPTAVLKDLLTTAGDEVDLDGFLADTEQRLAAHFGVPTRSGTGTHNPQMAPRSPAESLSPSLQSHGGSSRPKTDAELEAEAEALVPESWVRMGKGGW